MYIYIYTYICIYCLLYIRCVQATIYIYIYIRIYIPGIYVSVRLIPGAFSHATGARRKNHWTSPYSRAPPYPRAPPYSQAPPYSYRLSRIAYRLPMPYDSLPIDCPLTFPLPCAGPSEEGPAYGEGMSMGSQWAIKQSIGNES